MKRKTLLLFICSAFLCLNAAPASADLFHFTVHRLDMTYSGGRFDASLDTTFGAAALTRDVSPISTVAFGPGPSRDFNIWMDISNFAGTGTPLDPFRADGAGKFTLTDTDSDTIVGDVAGTWIMAGVPVFVGNLSNVNWSQDIESDDLFNGDGGASASMSFGGGQWPGILTLLTASGAAWFEPGDWGGTVTGGSVDALVVPVPAAVLLAILGLGVAGVKLRKFA